MERGVGEMELRRLTVKEIKRPNLITVLLVIKLHFGLLCFVFFFFFKKRRTNESTDWDSVSEKAKHMNGNSDQRLFHILAKKRMSYSTSLWYFSDCKGKENVLDVKLGEF